MTQLSDEILYAYADGELGPAQIKLVDGVLATDKVTRQRYDALKQAKRRLSGAFSSMLHAETKLAERRSMLDAQPRPHVDEIPLKTTGSIMAPAAALGVLLVCVGALGGYFASNKGGNERSTVAGDFWNKESVKAEEARSRALIKQTRVPATTAATAPLGGNPVRQWFETVASRHQKDAGKMLNRYNGASRNREMALFQFSNQAIAPSMIPVLKEENILFVGASPIKIAGRDYARLAYRDVGNSAVPVALYVSASMGGSLTLERGYLEDENYVRWTQGTRSYMLIGTVPHWRLIVLSVAVQRQLVQ